MPASLIPTETASGNIWDQYRCRKSCYLRLRSWTWFEIHNLRNSCSASDKMCLQSTESSGWITKYKDSGKQVFAVWSSIAFYSSDWLCSQDNLAGERGLSISISENNWKFSENMRKIILQSKSYYSFVAKSLRENYHLSQSKLKKENWVFLFLFFLVNNLKQDSTNDDP